MGRRPCCTREGLNRGAWTAQEDKTLVNYINIHGEGKWRDLPERAGLNRCGKSCRFRWLNYLRPGIKRGNISMEEEELIVKMHKLLGNRWSLIAGRLPGRTDNEIKNYWNTKVRKRMRGYKCPNSNKHLNELKDKNPIESYSSTALNPGIAMEPHRVIRTKAVRCTNVSIPAVQLDNDQMMKKNGVPTWERERPVSSSLPEDDPSGFFMDFDISDLMRDVGLNLEFNQESHGNEVAVDYGAYMSSGLDVPLTAYEAMPSSSNNELILDSWRANEPLQANEAWELKRLASVLDSESEWIQ